MPQVRVRVRPAEEIAALSDRRPDDTFVVLSAHQSDGRLLALLEVKTDDPDGFLACFEDVFAGVVVDYEMIGTYDEAVLVQYEMPTPSLYRAGRELGSLVEFPIPVADGWLVFDLFLSETAIGNLEATFDELGYPYRISSVTRSYETAELLTTRQQEFVTAAIDHGYYDTPRTCSLTDLADEFDVSKSAASGILHRAEGKIVKEFESSQYG